MKYRIGSFLGVFYLLIAGTALIVNGCDRIKCRLEKKIVSNVATVVANGLDCSDPAAVTASIQMLADQLDICSMGTRSRGPICTTIADFALERLAPKVIPPIWDCHPSSTSAKFRELVLTACSAIPF